MIGCSHHNTIHRFLLRYFLYLLIPGITIEILVLLAGTGCETMLFSENCVLEWAQFSLLIFASLCLFLAARHHIHIKESFIIIAIFPLIAAIRELDSLLSHYFYADAWKVLSLIPIFSIVYLMWNHRIILKGQLVTLIQGRSFALLFSGFLIVMVFSRLIAQKILWQAIMKEQYIRLVSRVVEESFEFMGYQIILLGAVETLFDKSHIPPHESPLEASEQSL